MADDLRDLLPLFASEAKGRLERLTELVPGLASDAGAVREIRRELHALKGASRMIGLSSFAEACHAAEDVMGRDPLPTTEEAERLVDAMVRAVEVMAAGETPQLDGDAVGGITRGDDEAWPSRRSDPPAESTERAGAGGELRVPAEVLGELADRATHLRVAVKGFEALRARIEALATRMEAPAEDMSRDQLIATATAALRNLALDVESSTHTVQMSVEQQLDTLLRLQMQPLKPVLQQLARHARQLAQTLGKSVSVELRGGETRLDRRVVETLSEAFLHLVRNAVDHGVAESGTRDGTGVPSTGQVTIAAASSGQRVTVTVADDGPGIDADVVADRAVGLGLIDAQRRQSLTSREALQLLLVPGFTTRDHVTDVSGRGVGLDAVAAATQRIGGDLWVESEPGRGTAVTVEVPAMRRGERLVVVRSGPSRVGLPAAVVSQYSTLTGSSVIERDGRSFARLDDRLVAFVPLAQLVSDRSSAPGNVLIEGTAGGASLAVAVDEVLAEEEVLIRPLRFRQADVFEGMSLLSSGRPILVLSPTRIAQAAGAIGSRPGLDHRSGDTGPLQVLLVDDSRVTREMERRLLEDAGFEVVAVADAELALRAMAEHSFDCLVTDVEMPGMDGLELTRRIRQMPGWSTLPVVVVSTRDRPEDRLAGLEAGADGYLVKQGLDPSELVGIIRRVGGG